MKISIRHSKLTLCSMLSTTWQADYRLPRNENEGFLGVQGVCV
jgi:hypothetical protein